MLHNTSSDPVLIKKISLKIWSLRDEIELRLQQKIDAGELAPENLEERIKEVRNEFTKKTATGDNVLPLAPESGPDEGELAMAQAMEAEEKGETPLPEENNVLSMPSTSNAPTENLITIGIEAPPLPPEKMFKGKTILSEITMEKMFFFSNRTFTEGQAIVIQFCIPKTFILNADVLYCRPFNIKSRIISENNYTHRMLVRFNFLREGERALLREFIKSIEPDLTQVAVKETEQGGSEFDELDL